MIARADYYSIIRESLEPLQEYLRGGEDAKLKLELHGDRLDVEEEGKMKSARGALRDRKETFEFNASHSELAGAYAFGGMIFALHEAGDEVGVVVDRETLKNSLDDRLAKALVGTHVWISRRILNDAMKRFIEKYDVFGPHVEKTVKEYDASKNATVTKEKRVKDLDHLILGYRLRDNVHVVIKERSYY